MSVPEQGRIAGVLIVAKCNVNYVNDVINAEDEFVLIVAKCNVNDFSSGISNPPFNVLIVAKCNVNVHRRRFLVILGSINSSKV